MNNIEKIDVGDYTIIVDSSDNKFQFKALRHGEAWIDNLSITDGSNMIMAMFYEIQNLREQLIQKHI